MTTMNVPIATTSRRNHIPGEAGIWVLIGGDILVFSFFFIAFLAYRMETPEIYAAAQTLLNQDYGVFNTVLMLSSSWFVAMAVQAARNGHDKFVPIGFMAAFCCGFGFAVVKFFEYSEKIHHGITISTNDFFMYYYVFTGIHLLHVFIGMGVLIYLSVIARSAPASETKLRNLESGASFWHVVDLLWIVLFALFYLVR
jgi:nitric oxide reductase NorE protein